MKLLNLEPNTPEWEAARWEYHCASEAPIVFGVSKNVKRNELLRLKATGDEQEFSDFVRSQILDHGHEVEALARPIAEQIIGEDLYPAVAVSDDGYLLASFDGLTMAGNISWECKQWNEEKAEIVCNGAIPPEDIWQVVHQLALGVEKCLYMITDGTEDRTVYTWYESNPEEKAELLRHWKQFDEDAATYQPKDEVVTPVGSPVADLPAISVKVSGSIDIIDNFKVFESAMHDFLENRLIKEPKTDQDFADLDTQIKALKKAEGSLEAAESYMLAQVSSIDSAKRMKDMLQELVRSNRLASEKLFEAEKKNRRNQILKGGQDALSAHIQQINKTLGGKIVLPQVSVDFAGAMKNKRTITSLQDAVDTELARVKIEANQIADKIRLNLQSLREDAKGYEMLFADAQQLVLKDNEDVQNVIKLRIADEVKRLDDEREKIRQEEQAKAESAAQTKPEAKTEPIPVSATPAVASAAPSKSEGRPSGKVPTLGDMLRVLSEHYGVGVDVVLKWLKKSMAA